MVNKIKYTFLLLMIVFSWQLNANECRKLFSKGALEQAEIVCKQLSETADKGSDDYFWAQFILYDIAHYLGDQEQAYKQLLTISEQPLDDNIRYELLRRQGHYYRLKKRYHYAQPYYLEALSIAENQQDQKKSAKSYNEIGLIYLKEHKYQQSIEYFKKSLSIKKQLGNKILMRSTLTNIGLLSYKTGDYKSALSYYTQAEELLIEFQQAQNNSEIVSNQLIHLYSYLAAVHEKLLNYPQRDAYLLLLDNGISQLKNDNEVLNRYLNEVEVLIEANSFYVAKKIIEKIDLELKNNQDNNAQLYYQLSFLEYQFNNFDIAKIYAKKSLKAMQTYKTQDYQEKTFHLLYLIEKELNNHRNALMWHEKFTTAKVKDIENMTSHDFRLLRYEQNIENTRGNLLQEKLKSALLEKKKTRYYLGLISTLAVFCVAILVFYYQRKVMLNNNRLLNKDIEKHKEICKNLQKPPVNFKYLLRNKPFPYMILDEVNRVIHSNFLNEEAQKNTVLKALLSSSMEPHIESGMLTTQLVPVPETVEHELKLSYPVYYNVQRVISNQYCLLFFCQENDALNISSELNALEQFEFHLNHQDFKDPTYTRKLVVDCMTYCLKIWKQRTKTNKVEFADQSKIWKINIDEGRLRTRSLDKYFSLNSVPKNPRMVQVIKSCHFMLTLPVIDAEERSKFKFYLSKFEQT